MDQRLPDSGGVHEFRSGGEVAELAVWLLVRAGMRNSTFRRTGAVITELIPEQRSKCMSTLQHEGRMEVVNWNGDQIPAASSGIESYVVVCNSMTPIMMYVKLGGTERRRQR